MSAPGPTPPSPPVASPCNRICTLNDDGVCLGCGRTLDDIVDVTTFSTDPEKQFETVLAVKDELFTRAPYPNWTALGVNWLAGFDFEIKVIAKLPERAEG